MNPKLKAEILTACFCHQLGFMPLTVTEAYAAGNGYGLAWDWPQVRIVNQAEVNSFEQRVKEAIKQSPSKKKFAKSARPKFVKKMVDIKEIANELGPYSEYDRTKFTKLGLFDSAEITAVTPKAILVDGHWLAKSQLRVDTDYNLYVANWLYEKEFC